MAERRHVASSVKRRLLIGFVRSLQSRLEYRYYVSAAVVASVETKSCSYSCRIRGVDRTRKFITTTATDPRNGRSRVMAEPRVLAAGGRKGVDESCNDSGATVIRQNSSGRPARVGVRRKSSEPGTRKRHVRNLQPQNRTQIRSWLELSLTLNQTQTAYIIALFILTASLFCRPLDDNPILYHNSHDHDEQPSH